MERMSAADDVFVIVANDTNSTTGTGAAAVSASTWFYHPDVGLCTRIGTANLDPIGMNYMMTWDPTYEVVFLVTGDWHGTVTVWALRPRP